MFLRNVGELISDYTALHSTAFLVDHDATASSRASCDDRFIERRYFNLTKNIFLTVVFNLLFRIMKTFVPRREKFSFTSYACMQICMCRREHTYKVTV
jgi:hypothetical protein